MGASAAGITALSMATLFGGLGAGLGGYRMKNRTEGLTEFRFQRYDDFTDSEVCVIYKLASTKTPLMYIYHIDTDRACEQQDGGCGDGVGLDGGGRGRQAHFRRTARPDEPQGDNYLFTVVVCIY